MDFESVNDPLNWDQHLIMDKLGYNDPFLQSRAGNTTNKLDMIIFIIQLI